MHALSKLNYGDNACVRSTPLNSTLIILKLFTEQPSDIYKFKAMHSIGLLQIYEAVHMQIGLKEK
jgi:hypothetical protein